MSCLRFFSLSLVVCGALVIGIICGCEGDPDTENVDQQFGDNAYNGGSRGSTTAPQMVIDPSSANMTNLNAVATFSVDGANGGAKWSVQDPTRGRILSQGPRSAVYENLAAGLGNVVIATDTRGNVAFATIHQ